MITVLVAVLVAACTPLAAQQPPAKDPHKAPGHSTTTTAPPPATAPAPDDADPPGDGGQVGDEALPYGPDAPWNVPVAGLPAHPQSSTYAQMLWNDASDRPGNFNTTSNSYTWAVYRYEDATGQYPVQATYENNLENGKVPWNAAWKAPSDSDAMVIIVDAATGRNWEIYHFNGFSGGVVQATRVSLVPGSFWGKEDGHPPSRGAGIQYLAMLVRPWEIEQGEIRHALPMSVSNTNGEFYVAPATKLEHQHSYGGVPEGMRFALNVTDAQIEAWVATKPAHVRNAARVIGKALRDYGWFITDTGGSAKLQFEHRLTAGDRWDALGLYDDATTRDLLDGLITQARIRVFAPSDQY